MLTTTQEQSAHHGPESEASPGAWELIAAAQGGDREAFGQLYQRYAPEVTRFVFSRTGDRALAEDLTGETFARALRRVDSVSEQGQELGAWFTTIAKNLVKDHYKSQRVQRERLTGDPADFEPLVARDPDPEQEVINRETAATVRATVWAAVAGLSSADQRECVRLRFYEDRSLAETATAMGREVGAVKSLRQRAVVALRARLTEPAEDPLVRARRAVTAAEHRARATAEAPTQRVGQSPTHDHATELLAGGEGR